jgi:hypothetical protein
VKSGKNTKGILEKRECVELHTISTVNHSRKNNALTKNNGQKMKEARVKKDKRKKKEEVKREKEKFCDCIKSESESNRHQKNHRKGR